MKEIKCLSCENMVPQTEGKRQKLFCSSSCRVSHHRKSKNVEHVEVKKTTNDAFKDNSMILKTINDPVNIEYAQPELESQAPEPKLSTNYFTQDLSPIQPTKSQFDLYCDEINALERIDECQKVWSCIEKDTTVSPIERMKLKAILQKKSADIDL